MAKEAVLSAKYTSYPKYNNTGVSWLPDMPQGWRVTKLKFLVRALESGVSVNAADYPKSEGEFGVLKTSCVYTREFRAEENKTVFEEEITRVKCPVKADSIIISRMNTPALVGAAAYVDADYKDLYLPDRLWQTVYNDEKVQSSKYLHYFMYLRGFRDEISNYAEGASSSMQNIAKEDFLSINLLLPSREEQQKIANFLDHETAKIDTLIDKQQQLITLLKEKRQAVISHAVTKGLNYEAPMRDSGVEWLGEVPEHWGIGRLKNVLEIRNGKDYKDVEVEVGGYPVYGSGGEFKRSSSYLFDGKSVLFGRKGTVDKPLVVSGKFWTVDTMFYSEINKNTVAEYIYYQATMFPFDLLSTNTALPSMTQEDLLMLGFAIPPIEEQENIVQFITNKCDQFNLLIEKAESAITLMQERRTAIISAAVTGKIDLRNWQAPKVSNNNKEVAV
jgi:type I restriction enzyme S subunit